MLRDPSSPNVEVLQRVVHHVKSHPDILADPSRWIVGMGWDQNLWADPHYPTAVCAFILHRTFPRLNDYQDDFDLESLLRGRRIYLDRVDVHAAWVSNRVLQLMGELPNEVDGGLIIRDSSGKPTGKTAHNFVNRTHSWSSGIFVDAAMDIVPVPALTKTQLRDYFDRTVRDAHAVGLTSVHDAATESHEIQFYQEYVLGLFTPTWTDFRQDMPQLGNFLYVHCSLKLVYTGTPLAPALPHGPH